MALIRPTVGKVLQTARFQRLLFFIDETWQKVAGTRVGALGAVAIPQEQYNGFCGAFYRMKKEILGADELRKSEIKGQHASQRRRSRLPL